MDLSEPQLTLDDFDALMRSALGSPPLSLETSNTRDSAPGGEFIEEAACKGPPSIPGCSILSLATSKKPKRSRFGQQRRREVAAQRKVGACLRCQATKVSVRWSSETSEILDSDQGGSVLCQHLAIAASVRE